tara:strand:- start:5548 stop:6207 length:660 start_codon:yes stop_codon:yes gene_type:complete
MTNSFELNKSTGNRLQAGKVADATTARPGPMKHRDPGAAQDLSFARRKPAGDNIERDICDHCGLISYENPKIVVGSVVTYEDKFLLCRRAIEPRKGFWTLPAGFMEHGESVEDGAKREAREEANVEITLRNLLAIYSIPRLSQVQIMFCAEMLTPKFSAGPESLEVALFGWDEIPWAELAFPSVHWALTQFNDVKEKDVFAPFGNPEGANGNLFPDRQL